MQSHVIHIVQYALFGREFGSLVQGIDGIDAILSSSDGAVAAEASELLPDYLGKTIEHFQVRIPIPPVVAAHASESSPQQFERGGECCVSESARAAQFTLKLATFRRYLRTYD
jgi:hypothetical protein